MPQINIAMMASRTQPLFARASSISGEVSSVKNTFSSWDNCMQKSYCKWPAIVLIIIAGLIVFSILWCIVRCACCGLSCCCTCFSCLKCCGNCCGMCDGGRKDRSHKNLDDPFRPQPLPVQSPAPVQPTPWGYQAPKPMTYEAPQFARFETGRSGLAVDPQKLAPNVHEDALPPMPSWQEASSRRIPTAAQKEEGMEMGNLTPDGQNMPLMSGGVGGARSPVSPVSDGNGGFFGGRGQNGYMQGQPSGNMPSGPGGISRTGSPAMMNGRGGTGGPGYGGPSTGNMAMGGQPRGQFNQSPGPGMNGPGMNGPGMNGPGMNGPGMGYGGPNRGDMAIAGAGAVGGGMGGPPRGQYNSSPGPQGFNNQRPGFPAAGGYRGPPQRQYSNNSNSPYDRSPQPQRQYSNDSGARLPLNGPQRQYSNDAGAPYPRGNPQGQFSGNAGLPRAGPQRLDSTDSYRPSQDMHRPPVSPSSPLNNSGGFDFTGDSTPARYEPPVQRSFGQDGAQTDYAPSTTAPPSYATRAPPPSNGFHFQDNDHHQRSFSPVQEVHEMPVPDEPVATKPDGGIAYPGYKPYSPAPVEAARSTPPPPPSSLMPGRSNY